MTTATAETSPILPTTAANQATRFVLLLLDTDDALSTKLSAEGRSLLAGTESLCVEQAGNVKTARKILKRNPDAAILLVNLAGDTSTEHLETIKFVRTGLRNQAIRIIACDSAQAKYSEQALVQEYEINSYKTLDALTPASLLATILAELKTYKLFKNNATRRQAEVNLLTTLAQFSRMELSLSDCYKEFNNTIGLISGALLSNVLLIDADDGIARSNIVYARDPIADHIAEKFLKDHRYQFNNIVKKAAAEGALQICLDKDDGELNALATMANVTIDGSVAFPLKSYRRTLAVIQCFLQKEQLDQVSVELIHLVEKSSEQLSVLLERQEAETNLKKQYEHLKSTLQELKSTKAQLYQSEKMASIGQLAAGIAHEINNPIAYVMSNFSPLDEYVATMMKLLNLHTDFMESIDKKDKFATQKLKGSIATFAEQADINFVLDDVRSLVQDSQDGLLRVKEIITNLKAFSHVETVDSQPVDIHQNLESTLKILEHQTKIGIQIIKDYGELPDVPCNPGLINQVFMNLIQNAIHALAGEGEIRIKTRQVDDTAQISIRDNGSGIPEDKLSDIFNPFFTTKPVGQGTGLGLSMSHSIMEKHNGTITVDTQEGEFTEFTLTLPLTQPDSAAEEE